MWVYTAVLTYSPHTESMSHIYTVGREVLNTSSGTIQNPLSSFRCHGRPQELGDLSLPRVLCTDRKANMSMDEIEEMQFHVEL